MNRPSGIRVFFGLLAEFCLHQNLRLLYSLGVSGMIGIQISPARFGFRIENVVKLLPDRALIVVKRLSKFLIALIKKIPLPSTVAEVVFKRRRNRRDGFFMVGMFPIEVRLHFLVIHVFRHR